MSASPWRRLGVSLLTLALALMAMPLGMVNAAGTISLTSVGTPYAENFDTLASTGTSAALPNGWWIAESGTNADGLYAAGTGSSNAGNTYSFGALSNPERALGGLRSGSLVPLFGASLTNNTAETIGGLDIAYVGEQWRLGATGRADKIDFQYSLDATSLTNGFWIDVNSLDFQSPSTTGTVGPRDGNAAANRASRAATVVVAIPSGSTIWIRWTDTDVTGSDDGLAVDDFSVTARGPESGPTVIATTPVDGSTDVAADSNVTITFNEPVNVTGAWFAISCATSGVHSATVAPAASTFVLDPDSDFALSEACSVTVYAAQVTDQDNLDPPDNMSSDHVFSFTIVAPPTLIREIQGTSHISPKVDQTVSNVPGVITARARNGVWIQDTAPDGDNATSEGIFVFTSSAPPITLLPGVTVKVSGRVVEFRGSRAGDLTLTEISSPSITITGVATVPAPIVLGAAGRQPPVTVIENDAAGNVETSNTFDPAEDGIDFYESLEGMLVSVESAVAVSRTTRFGNDRSGEIWVLGDGGAAATTRSERGAVVISSGDFNPERILVDDEIFKSVTPMPDVNVGAVFSGALTGPLDYAFSNYRIQLLAAPVIAADLLTREVTEPATKNELSVATFNVENLDANDPQQKFDELARLIVTNLQAPDIIGLEEVQDDNGPINDGTVTAGATIARLIDAIVAAGGPTYDWRSVDPENNQDGGEPGGNIRVGFIFRTDGYVKFIDRPGATATTANSVLGQHSSARLAYSPGRVAPADPAWVATRKPVAAEFRFRGEQVFIIVNHFSSKGGDDALYGWRQPPVFGSEVKRIRQAQAVNDFVSEILAADPKANVIVLGDINDFQFSPVMNALRGDDLNVLIDTLPVGERYSYVFDGNGQALDHILISDALFAQPFEYDIVHVNAEFSAQASDHDPQLVRLGIKGTAKKD